MGSYCRNNTVKLAAEAMPKTKKTKPRKHKRSTVQEPGKKLSGASSPGATADLFQEISKLPQFELYPERKLFWDNVTHNGLDHLRHCLCTKYSELYKNCKGKYAYLDLQVGWHDFLRNVASTVESHSVTVHITDKEQGSVITSPVGWGTIHRPCKSW